LVRGCTKTYELKIFDAIGRKIRTHKITNNMTFLKPLRKSGIYFIVFSHAEYSYQEKLIVLD
ncbi:MAG: T9SS type A sorting domain-containing protein, partial [candidate division WOR-3 bacterium]